MKISILKQLESELRIMDLNDLKPNYAALGRKYDLDYRTVKKYHQGYKGKPRSRDKPSKLDAYKNIIIEKLEIPRVTRKGVYEFLIDTYGVDKIGTYSNFKAYCKKNKLKPVKSSQASGGNTLYETEAGDMAQCDWKEDIQMISKYGEVFIVNIFHLVLKFSRYSYIELTLSKEQPVVFRCLINAFCFYGGIPQRILFDNMSTVIDTSVRPKRVNNKMVQFAKDMNFTVQACKVRHAYTKGTNEARNKILDWIRPYNNEFESYEDLIKVIDSINMKMNTEICEGTNIPPCVLFYKEKEYLNPLPDTKFMDRYITPSKVLVSSKQLVLYKGKKYSVDRKYIGEYVHLDPFNDILQIYYKGKLIQTHQITSNLINYKNDHYKQTLGKNISQGKIDDVVSTNLRIMDSLLERRQVIITRNDACKSHHALVAYLVSQGSISNWIKRFIQSLSKEKRETFYKEITKLLPYVENEEQFFCAFKQAVDKDNIELTRVYFWGLDTMGNYKFLSQEGANLICDEFEKETTLYLENVKEKLGGN